MARKRRPLSRRASVLPAKYTRGFPWLLDQRCQVAREVATDLLTLWTDLGGIEALSAQQQWLVERVVFMRRRMLAYETAVLNGTGPPMTAGEYSTSRTSASGTSRRWGSSAGRRWPGCRRGSRVRRPRRTATRRCHLHSDIREVGRLAVESTTDPELFGRFFQPVDSWEPWRTFLRVLFGLPLSGADAALFHEATGRSAAFTGPLSEVWALCGGGRASRGRWR